MIKSIQFKKGFPLDLPCIGNKRFEFTDGVNFLVGSNGCGKSTLIKTLKAYTGIQTGGWTKFNSPQTLGCGRMNGFDFPDAYSTYSPANCQAVVVWNGLPTLYNDGDLKTPELLLLFNMQQFSDGITNENDLERQLKENPSAGQYRLMKLNKIVNLIKDGPPVYTKEDLPTYKDKDDNIWAKREWDYWQFIKKLYTDNIKTGATKHTILLDEPERSLSYAKQKDLFLNIIPNLLKDFQVIVASHSIYSIYCPNANFVEMENDYVTNLKYAINDIAKLSNIKGQMELSL